jgi:hypothetical protein
MRIFLAIVVIVVTGHVVGAAPGYRVTTVGPNMTVRIIGPKMPKKQTRSYFVRPPYNPTFDGYAGAQRAPRARATGGRYNPPYQGEPLIVLNPYCQQKPDKPEKPDKPDLFLIFGTSDPIGYWD